MNPHIGIMGAMRSGKDSLAAALVENHGYTKLAFADPIRDAMYDLNPRIRGFADAESGPTNFTYRWLMNYHGYEVAKDRYPETRRMLQRYGMFLRENVDANIWVNHLLRRAYYNVPAGDPIVVPDVRFVNEADALKSAGFLLVRMIRPGVRPISGHVSEVSAKDIPVDTTIVNADPLAMSVHAEALTQYASPPGRLIPPHYLVVDHPFGRGDR